MNAAAASFPAVPCAGDRRELVTPISHIPIAGHHGFVGIKCETRGYVSIHQMKTRRNTP